MSVELTDVRVSALSSSSSDLIFCFSCLFSDVPSQTSFHQHDIDVKDGKAHKTAFLLCKSSKTCVNETEGAIFVAAWLRRPSSSPWSSPCLVLGKPDGTPRFITDSHKVNAVTVPDSYTLPHEDCVDNPYAAKFVSKLDLLNGH